jgi:hypothetical protein
MPAARPMTPVQPSSMARDLVRMPTPWVRSKKMRFLSSIVSVSAMTLRTSGMRARMAALKPGVGSAAMPPMRAKLCVMRAPVSASRMCQSHSRTFRIHRKGVKAPSSMAAAPLHVKWSQMRAISASITR